MNLKITISPLNQTRVRSLFNRRHALAFERLVEVVGLAAADEFVETKLGSIYFDAAYSGMDCIIRKIGPGFEIIFQDPKHPQSVLSP